VIRKWKVPSKPRAAEQKVVRTKLAAFGKNLIAMKTSPPAGTIVGLIRAVTPANTILSAYFAKHLEYVKSADNWTAIKTASTGCAQKAKYDSEAPGLAKTDLSEGVIFSEAVPAVLQLLLGAFDAFKLQLKGRADYTVHPEGWAALTIEYFAQDYTKT